MEAICEQVGTQLLQPVFAKIEALPLQEIVFVPSALLHFFPLHAASLSEKERWVDRYCISYTPSASVLFHKWTTSTTGPRIFVGFADSMEDLPMTRIEVQKAADLFAGSTKLYYGQDVSRDHVINALGQADWVHFACHAKQELLDNYSTGLYLSNAKANKAADFLKSFYDLTGTYIFPQQCYNRCLSLRNWGSGPTSFRGAYRYSRRFIAAGADAVIATYWKVRDTCAILILDRFYTNLRNGSSLSNALRDARLFECSSE